MGVATERDVIGMAEIARLIIRHAIMIKINLPSEKEMEGFAG
ncbi:MAG: hypothetical protein ACETVW_03705 [Dehalococcoidia bacterium]